jgi:menaquinone-specific isochorismate synthase
MIDFDLEWLNCGAVFTYSPHEVLIAWGKAVWQKSPENNDRCWFYFPDYFLKEKKQWLQFEYTRIISLEDLRGRLKKIPIKAPSAIMWDPPTKEPYDKGFDSLKNLFKTTNLTKTVLYALSRSSSTFSIDHRIQALINILEYIQKAPAFMYGYWMETEGVLGATPEVLFKLENKNCPKLFTMALAGTQKNSVSLPSMLLDPKLIREHQIVVDDITERLQCFGPVELGERHVLKLPMLSHINTQISVALDHTHEFNTYVKALHPTPALGGFPQELALKWLLDYNKIAPRGRYGAPAGFWNPHKEESACYVAIRNVMWDNKGLTIGAGGGITEESELDEEWAEMLLKTDSIKCLITGAI